MLRFCDKEVYTIEKEDINRETLNTYFKRNEQAADVVLVYDKGEFCGTICSSSLSISSDDNIDKYICKDRYVHTKDDYRILEYLKDILKRTILPMIPVFDLRGEVILWAYDDKKFVEEIETVFCCLEKKKAPVFLKEMYPRLQAVRIYNLNEWAIRFYNILSKYGIPVAVYGEKWNILFPSYTQRKINCIEGNIMNIYAEGSEHFISESNYVENWLFVKMIGRLNHLWFSNEYRQKYKKKGINILTVQFPNVLSDMTLEEEYRQAKTVCLGLVGPDLWSKKNIADQLIQVCGKRITYQDWIKAYEQKKIEYIYLQGRAVATKHFGESDNKIYIIGPCIAGGATVMEDSESLGGCLYERLQKNGIFYSVVCIMLEMWEYVIYQSIFEYLTVTDNDIVLVIDNLWPEEEAVVAYKTDIQIKPLLEKRNCDWFYDYPIHTNFIGNNEIANMIADEYLLPLIKKKKKEVVCLQLGSGGLNELQRASVYRYLDDIKYSGQIEGGKNVGAIVMNCNPMTKGHLYLINEARKEVDYLYIFVVEEDRSEFKFKERFEMVINATSKMKQVLVVPSGKFVLSGFTLPLYFEKAQKREEILDATVDLRLFGEYIAPGLGISKRFVGEEKKDLVTRQYNEQMKRILSYYGVDVIEIPRLCVKNEIISASKVRELIHLGEWEKIRSYVPKHVYEYLKNGM